MKLKTVLNQFIYPKLKFGTGSIISTGVDYSIFFILLKTATLPVAWVQVIAQTLGMITNFILQRNFIFAKERTVIASFFLSVSFSLVSITLAGILVHYLYKITFFFEHPMIMKIGVSILFFFFNFYTKQFAFEKKLKW
ncbi:MAG: GtrA family protein [Balneola sp.]